MSAKIVSFSKEGIIGGFRQYKEDLVEVENELKAWDREQLSQEQTQWIQEMLGHGQELLIQLVDSVNKI